MKIITLYPNFSNVGGAQNVALLLARKLGKGEKNIVLCNNKNIASNYKCDDIIYDKFSIYTVFKYRRNVVFVSHSRLYTTLLMIIKLFVKLHIVHIAHNEFYNLGWFTLLPKVIVAVSSGVKDNLVNYFAVKEDRIRIIHNGIEDIPYKENVESIDKDSINILLAGRICKTKRQVELVKRLRNSLPSNIKFYFAGVGDDLVQLQKEILNDNQFKTQGHLDLSVNISKYDYVLLFSEREGLGLVLLEGCRSAKPLITNSLPSVLDVNCDGYNGFVYNDWVELKEGLKKLPHRDDDAYKRLSKNSRLTFEHKFRVETMVDKYEKMIFNIKNNT